jgi:hypothetical protein
MRMTALPIEPTGERVMRAFRYAVALLAITCLAVPVPAAGQDAPAGQAAEVTVLVELPVAVARAADAGVPLEELRDIVRQLRDARIQPHEAIDLIRFATVTEALRGDRPDGMPVQGAADAPGLRLSELIRDRLAAGVRGTQLADEIHRELRRQGVPVAAQRRGPRPLSPDFIPPEGRRPDRTGPPAGVGPPGRPGQQGPPDRPGASPDRPGAQPDRPGANRPDGPGEATPRPPARSSPGGDLIERDGGDS